MSAGAVGQPGDAEEIAAVLAKHQPVIQGSGGFFTCSCDKWGWGCHDGTYAQHVAAALTDYLARRDAEVAARALREAAADWSGSTHGPREWLYAYADRIAASSPAEQETDR